jgi:CHAT domain-containing protein
MYREMREYSKAEPLLRQSLAIRKEALGEKHPDYGIALNSLALLYRDLGEFDKAEPLLRQALTINGDMFGDKSDAYVATLNNLAELYWSMGNYVSAERSYRQALELGKDVYGASHPRYAIALGNLAVLYESMGDYARAEPFSHEALAIMRRQLGLSANIQSERQQLRMAESVRPYFSNYLSTSEAANVPAAKVYGEVLIWKGSVSARQQAVQQTRKTLGPKQSPELVRLFDNLSASSCELSNQTQVVPMPGNEELHRRKLVELSERVERLQQQLVAESQVFRLERRQQERTPDDIVRALPPGTALVDLLEYTHFDPAQGKIKKPVAEQRLLAFVIRADQPVARIELGSVSLIAGFIDLWRKNSGKGNASHVVNPGQELRRLVWEKLEPHLQGTKVVLLSPDGDTARFPWAALPGKDPDKYLIEETSIAILPIPRLLPELIADNELTPSGTPSLLLVGGVDFEADPGRIGAIARGNGAARGDQPLHWQPLPGTLAEVARVKSIFEGRYPNRSPSELTGAAATKYAVREKMSSSCYLHFSTHGFFAAPQVKSAMAVNSYQNIGAAGEILTRQDFAWYHPDLLSGLVLAGANRPMTNDQEDGILTALEVSSLDLSHVELATLAACETGLGETAGGEGLLGLQRAFQLAGAKTTVASLWQVPDGATQLLMERFYQNLWNRNLKVSKLDALLDAQRWVLREGAKQSELSRGAVRESDKAMVIRKSNRLPPYYWAAFVLSGDWR